MGAVLLDIEPLRRFPDFRRLWVGYVFRQLGAQIAVTTVIYQVFILTGSNLAVGLLSLVQLGPAIVAPMIGGAIADAVDRRRLLIVVALLLAACSVGLALNTAGGDPRLWPLFVLSAATWGLSGIDTPTRQAVLMSLVDRESFVQANVLRQLLSQIANIAGPAVAGVLIAVFRDHLSVVYWVDVGSTLFALQAVIRLPTLRPVGGGRRFGISSIVEGLRFLKGRQVIQGCFIADLIATVLGQPTSLYPYMALVRFHGGATAFGVLTAAPSIGAVLGSILSGWTNLIRRQGLAVIWSIVLWGVVIVAFGFSTGLWFGVVTLAVAGWANAVSALFRNTMVQLETPDRLRGRLSAVQSAVVQSGPRLGNLEGGLVAALTTVPFAIVSGGIGCIIGIAIMARRMPRFVHFDVSVAGDPDAAPDGSNESPVQRGDRHNR